MKFAVDRGWREDNPVEATRQRREDYDDDGDVARYTPDQVEAIVAEPASEQDRAAVTIAAFAGLRRGEILALRWKNVDFTARKLRVRKTYVMGEEASPKGRRVRAVDMADQVASVLARLGQRDHHVVPDDLVLVNAKVAKNVSTER